MDRIIPVGYIFTLTTWENDADNYKTESWCGLNKEQVRFLKTISDLFSRNEDSFGNEDNTDNTNNQILERVRELFNEVPSFLDCDTDINNDDEVIDLINVIIGYWSDYDAWRVADKYSIIYNPTKIEMNLVDEDLNPLENSND